MPERDRVGQIAEVPASNACPRPLIGAVGARGHACTARVEPLALQRAQVAARSEHGAVRVADLDPHREMRIERALVELRRVERHAPPLGERVAKRAGERLFAAAPLERRVDLGRRVGQRHERPAQILRQRAQQREDFIG